MQSDSFAWAWYKQVSLREKKIMQSLLLYKREINKSLKIFLELINMEFLLKCIA